jgi:hypothetical protein
MKSRPICKPCLKKSKYKASTGICSDLRTNLSFVVNEVFLEIWDSLLDCSQASKDSRRNFSGRVVSIESKSKRRYEGKKGRKIMDQGNEHDREPQRQRVTWAPSLDSVDSDDDNGYGAEEAVFPQHKIVKNSEKRDEIPISIRSNNESRLSAPSQVAKNKTSSSAASVAILPPQNSKEHLQDQKSKPYGTATDSSSAIGREKKIEGDRIKGVAMSQKQRASNIVNSDKKGENVTVSTERKIEGDRIKGEAISQKQRASNIVDSDKKSENVIESAATSRKKVVSDGAKKTQKGVTAQHEVSVVKQKKMGLPKLSSKLWLI